jgi:hypothetical protein
MQPSGSAFAAISAKKERDVAFGVRSIAANLNWCSGERRRRYSRLSSLLKRDVRAVGTERPAVLAPKREQRVSTFIGLVISLYSLWRVGAHLAVSAPPGTVRAPLNAYGSTLDTTERHIFQRGQCSVTSVLRPQLVLCPLVGDTEIAPIVVATKLSRDNLVEDDFGSLLQR